MDQYQRAIELLTALVESFELINDKAEIQSDQHEYVSMEDLLPAEIYTDDDYENIDENKNCSEYSFENDIDLTEILPAEIYDESLSVDLNDEYYSQSDHMIDDLLPTEIYSDLDSDGDDNNIIVTHGNAAIVTGPFLIDIDGGKAIMTYPFPCQIIQTYDDSQLGVRLAFPYNDVIQKLPQISIEQQQNEIDIIEQEYLEKINGNNLGYQSINQIQSMVFQ